MRVLVLTTQYPDPNGYVRQFFVHTRNRWYARNGIEVDVVSFGATRNYVIDDVRVYTTQSYELELRKKRYDLLVSHAPNLRNHVLFLLRHGALFRNMVFFFHGHEVLRTSEIYPEPYDYMRQFQTNRLVRQYYDWIKLRVLRSYFNREAYKSQFVFVSKWMENMFSKYVKLAPHILETRGHIIYNSVGEAFETSNYDYHSEKKYDFMTIRNHMDGAKYCIDLVVRIARANPQYKFCVVGKGRFFTVNKKPDNVVWLDKHLSHEEMLHLLNQARYALMPTRADAQGVSACEMATFGIPLITSAIDITQEVFEGFENVGFIGNENPEIEIRDVMQKIRPASIKNTRFFAVNTIGKELELFRKVTLLS